MWIYSYAHMIPFCSCDLSDVIYTEIFREVRDCVQQLNTRDTRRRRIHLTL